MAQGTSFAPILTLKTRDHRWNIARKVMESEKLDALFIWGDHEDSGPAAFNIDVWFTNSRPGSAILVPRHGDPIQLLGYPPGPMDHLMESNEGDEMWIDRENLRLGRGLPTIAATLKELGLSKAIIGVLGLERWLPFYMDGIIPYTLWSQVVAEFPDVSFRGVMEPFVRAMITLNDEEQACVRKAAAVGDAMAHALVAAAKPGALHSDVYAAGMFAAHSRGSCAPWLHFSCSPKPITWMAPKWSYKPMEQKVVNNGDVICTELFSFWGVIHTQEQVAIAVGDVHPDILRAGKVARECYEIGLKQIRPGVRFGDVGRAMLGPVLREGGWSRGPQIHTLNPLYGISGFTNDLSQVENMDRYSAKLVNTIPTILDDMVLQPGMSLALEPGCGFGTRTVTIGSSVIVGEDGAIELTPYTAYLHEVR